MPSDHFSNYSDEDLSDLIAYIKNIIPVDNDMGARVVKFPTSIIFGVVVYGQMPVNLADHENVGGQAPAVGPTAAYGEYLVNITACKACHASNLAGVYGQPQHPNGPNITLGGDLGGWTMDEFARTLQAGMRSDGQLLSNDEKTGMPWQTFAHMMPEEVEAIWVYISSLEALPNNE